MLHCAVGPIPIVIAIKLPTSYSIIVCSPSGGAARTVTARTGAMDRAIQPQEEIPLLIRCRLHNGRLTIQLSILSADPVAGYTGSAAASAKAAVCTSRKWQATWG